MARYRTSIRTPWTDARAFEYLRDLEHFANWDPGVRSAALVDGARGEPGSNYDVTVRGPGRDLTLRYEIVAADPPRRIEVRAQTSTLESVDVMTVVAAPDGGCTVTYDASLTLRGILGVANPLLALGFRRIGDRAAAGLRDAVAGEFVVAGGGPP